MHDDTTTYTYGKYFRDYFRDYGNRTVKLDCYSKFLVLSHILISFSFTVAFSFPDYASYGYEF